ncbi:MAG: 16S rRNA (cytidine(1402)-2'-O)-methyltransferase [Alphaproteobacteria bacterium]
MRQNAEDARAARKASGRDASGGGDPSHRAPASKPAPEQSTRQSERRSSESCGEPADTAAGRDPLDWQPAHELAPGLHLVATPIGNLGDITLRALWVLRGVDRILCEDTRVTARLLARFGIDKPLDPYHDHNADRVRPAVLDALRRGEKLALVSDAGTPLVSDPGFKLVRAALAEDLPVTAAPGPSAALTALILSGLPPDRFLFAGFLPSRSAARRRALAQWAALDATLIFFEGPSRLAASLADMAEILGAREGAVARELTKRHEEIRRRPLDALARHYRDCGPPRGEAVIVVGPPEDAPAPAEEDVKARLRTLLAGHSLRDAVALLADETGIARRTLYEHALALTHEEPEQG